MRFYHDSCEIRSGADPDSADIDFKGKIVLGKFVTARGRRSWTT